MRTGGLYSQGAWSAAAPAMSSAWVSDIGRQRARQDDRVAVGANFAVVADGVGSMPGGGEVAQVAVGHFSAAVVGARSGADVVAAFDDTQALILRMVGRGALPTGCATTLTAVVQAGDDVVVANVGDSPGWILDAEQARGIVRLHRRWDPFRESFVLVSALGSPDYRGPAVTTLTPGGRTRLVIATDGIVADPEDPDAPAVLTLARGPDVAVAARAVADEVLLGRARDNVTVVVLDVGPAWSGVTP